MASITPLGTPINIKLGQIAQVRDPELNAEYQSIYNALHILSQYLNTLRLGLEGGEGQTPSESLTFRSTFWAEAKQAIQPGNVVSSLNGGIVKGVLSSEPIHNLLEISTAVGSTGSRRRFGVVIKEWFIALTEAEVGELVQVGVGPGILEVTGAKSGQIVWAQDSRSIYTIREVNTSTQYLNSRDLVGNGDIFLANPIGIYSLTLASGEVVTNRWEGYWLPGFPFLSGGTEHSNRVFLYPVGVCVADGYVLINDYIRGDSPVQSGETDLP
ncbi:hypothetical protein D3C80_129190 [compost metagenome]